MTDPSATTERSTTPHTANARVPHPRAFAPLTLIVTILLSLVGAVTGLVLITSLGIAPNTAVIGALLAMTIDRAGIRALSPLGSPHRQNLVQSAVSGATFAAANSLITPIAVPYALGRPDLVWPLLGGAVIGLAVDSWVLYRVFDSRLLPAAAAWPAGVAAAETIKAGDEGGRRAAVLGTGALLGLAGSYCHLPMSTAGVALLGNAWALAMFGVGLFIAQYGPAVLHVDLLGHYVPQGMMAGASLVALAQAVLLMRGRGAVGAGRAAGADVFDPTLRTASPLRMRRGLIEGLALFLCGAALVAVVGGAVNHMSSAEVVGWVLLAGVAALVHQIIVGLAAMHSGWFPAFAVTLVFLILGLLLHIPPVPLVLLVGYTAATGPAFADLGFDFKAGWLLRRGAAPWRSYELAGRREQFRVQLVGFAVAIAVVALCWHPLFAAHRLPPVARVYGDMIKAGLGDPHTLVAMRTWAVPGALIQLAGGPSRQMGVLLATGLLVAVPQGCWLVAVALVLRAGYGVWHRSRSGDDGAVPLIGAGLIAGSSVADTAALFRTL